MSRALADDLCARFLYKALDAVLTAPLRPRRRWTQWVGTIVSPRSMAYDRVGAIVGLADHILPGTGRRAAALLTRTDRLPLAASRVELLGYGSGATVFLLATARGPLVLKAYRRSIGRRRSGLVALAREFRGKFATVSSWYRGREVVVPSRYAVLHGPLLGRPAVACLQPAIEGETRELLGELPDGELQRLMRESPGFREDLEFFAARTLEVWEREGRCADVLGEGNLLIVGKGESAGVRLLDCGIFDLGAARARSPAVLDRLTVSIERLRSLGRSAAAAARPRGGRAS